MFNTSLAYIVGAAGKMVVTSAITPMVQSTALLVSSLNTSPVLGITTLHECLTEHDVMCTLQMMDATCSVLKSNKEPIRTATVHIVSCVQQIHALLTRISDIAASHAAGYVSRWRQLTLDSEIRQLGSLMGILRNRFKLMCDIHSVTRS